MPDFEAWSQTADVSPGRPSAGFVRLIRNVVRPLVRVWWRPSLSGVENLPTTRPYILVANHSAGMGAAEIMSFGVEYLDAVGAERPLAGFAHPMSFRFEPMKTLMRHAGAIPSTYGQAESALAAGVPILVFPGGDHETTRPFWQANRVDFGGRRGFLRIAKKMDVPIVPMGIRGAHHTAPVLFRSTQVLPKALILPLFLGVKRWPMMLVGAVGAIAILVAAPWSWPVKALVTWLWLLSPLVFAPIVPWKIQFRIGQPMEPSEIFPVDETEEAYAVALQKVEHAVQTLVNQEQSDPLPSPR